MNTKIRVAALAVAATLSGAAQAALIDRGGGLIYDTDLNVTWLKDANYAQTSGYDADGRMTWGQSMTWADNLGYYDSVRGVTYTDWRLPDGKPINGGVTHDPTYSLYGASDYGYRLSAPGTAYAGSKANELAYLYYNSLGNQASIDANSVLNPCYNSGKPGSCLANVGPFVNIQESPTYWSNTTWTATTANAQTFSMRVGQSGSITKEGTAWYIQNAAWAVRPGDVFNMAPIAVSGSAIYAVAKDGLVIFSASGYDPDPYMGDTVGGYAWDLNGDGVFGDLSGTSATASWASLTGMGLLAGQDHTISLRVTDSKGAYGYTSATLQIAAVPEPETYAMMLAGLGLVGWAARRRGVRG